MKLQTKSELKQHAEQSLKCYLFTIEIQEKQWDWKEGDLVEVPVLAGTEQKAKAMIDDRFWGGEFPRWRVMSIRELGNNFLFRMQIEEKILNDAYKLGKESAKKKIKQPTP